MSEMTREKIVSMIQYGLTDLGQQYELIAAIDAYNAELRAEIARLKQPITGEMVREAGRQWVYHSPRCDCKTLNRKCQDCEVATNFIAAELNKMRGIE